eukprot:TRINITY_DN12927_c0_g3_i1.p1 TRINITY_DN12927_c0_g3~~TRINITY_DN12927_c0_g3_i1.p1  ORF type:complete len:755 (+),score=144.09 TRINITY_DN12927_c0_g3_i1:55-2319(+)
MAEVGGPAGAGRRNTHVPGWALGSVPTPPLVPLMRTGTARSSGRLQLSLEPATDGLRPLRPEHSRAAGLQPFRTDHGCGPDGLRPLRPDYSRGSDGLRPLRADDSRPSDGLRPLRVELSRPSDGLRPLRADHSRASFTQLGGDGAHPLLAGDGSRFQDALGASSRSNPSSTTAPFNRRGSWGGEQPTSPHLLRFGSVPAFGAGAVSPRFPPTRPRLPESLRTVQRKKLPRKVKLLMGVGESVQAIYVIVAGFYLNAYFLEVACLPARQVSLIQLMSGLWDSFNDPMVGRLSDRTRSRWGRRRPWLLFAAVPLGCAYVAVWNKVTLDEGPGRFLYYLLAYMGISMGITCVQVQIGSLTPELTDDYDERTSLATYRLAIGNIIAFACLMAHSQTVGRLTDEGRAVDGYRISSGFCGILMAVNALLTFAFIRESYVPPPESSETLGCLQGLRICLQNRAFQCVVAMYLCGPVAIVLVQTNLLMFCKYVVKDVGVFDYLVAIVFGTGMLCCPLWSVFAQRYGKKTAFYCGVGMTMSSVFGLFFLDASKGSRSAIYVLSTLAGSGLIVPYLIPYSMLPDVIEADELRTGERREGIYFGFFTIFLKLAVTAALSLTNAVLSAAGYEEPQSTCGVSADLADTQGDGVVRVLRWLVSPIPCAFFCCALFGAYKYPITREKHREILMQVEERRRSSSLRAGFAAFLMAAADAHGAAVTPVARVIAAFLGVAHADEATPTVPHLLRPLREAGPSLANTPAAPSL